MGTNPEGDNAPPPPPLCMLLAPAPHCKAVTAALSQCMQIKQTSTHTSEHQPLLPVIVSQNHKAMVTVEPTTLRVYGKQY